MRGRVRGTPDQDRWERADWWGVDSPSHGPEPRALVVPLDHRLAGKERVRLDDFADEPLVGVEDPVPDAFWRVLPRPDGRTPPPGPVIKGAEDTFEHVAAGDALSLAPWGRCQEHLRPDLTAIRVEDIEPMQVVVVHRRGEDSELLRDFRRTAAAHLVPSTTG